MGIKQFSTPLADFNQAQLDLIQLMSTQMAGSMFAKEMFRPYRKVYSPNLGVSDWLPIISVSGRGYLQSCILHGQSGECLLRITLDDTVFLEKKATASCVLGVAVCDMVYPSSNLASSIVVIGNKAFGPLGECDVPVTVIGNNDFAKIPSALYFSDSLLVEIKVNTASLVNFESLWGVA